MQKGTDQAVTRREHVLGIEAKRVVETDPFGGLVTNGNFTSGVDTTDGSTIYIGKAQIGTATDALGWQIKRITKNGSINLIQWAEATDDFINAWDERTEYEYS